MTESDSRLVFRLKSRIAELERENEQLRRTVAMNSKVDLSSFQAEFDKQFAEAVENVT